MVCALIFWRSGLGLLTGKFRQILKELSARDMPIFLFPNDNLSKHKGILTEVGTLFVLRFYGPVNPMGSCRVRSVYLTTLLLGRLSPLRS